MSTDPLLSIIIPHYNGAPHLPICFSALRGQTFQNFEIILVDNGSSDESVSLTRQQFPEVIVLEMGQNLGFSGAVNRGIVQARGDLIVLLNNDTEADPDWAAALVEAWRAHPQAGIIACKLRLFDQRDRLHSAGDSVGVDGIPRNRGVWQVDEGQFDQDSLIFGGCGGAVGYRRAMLDEIGLFDEDFFMYLEDVDLNWRAQLAGYQTVFAPQAIVYHKLSASGGGKIASYYTGRNTIAVLVKSVPSVVWRKHWGKILRAQAGIAWQAIKAWRGEAARARLRGQLVGLLSLPRWMSKRRTVQQTKRVSDEYLEGLLVHDDTRRCTK